MGTRYTNLSTSTSTRRSSCFESFQAHLQKKQLRKRWLIAGAVIIFLVLGVIGHLEPNRTFNAFDALQNSLSEPVLDTEIAFVKIPPSHNVTIAPSHLQIDEPKSADITSSSVWRWTYRCDPERGCLRHLLRQNEIPVNPEVCWLSCGEYGALWPYPTQKVKLGNCTLKFSISNVEMRISKADLPEETNELLKEMGDAFLTRLSMIGSKSVESSDTSDDINTRVIVTISMKSSNIHLGLDTDESYDLSLSTDKCSETENNNSTVNVNIKAATIFGTRHALESLSQLVAFDEVHRCLRILNSAQILDEPIFPHRGVLLDVSRNFIPVESVKRMIDGMAANKLNIFHWHLTDSNSFTFYSKRVPKMTEYGAYSAQQVYYPEDVKEVIHYAKVRGIKVVPELDQPAHAGNGWQWGPSENLGELAVCVNIDPWRRYCGQPPCGQLNPANNNTLEVLEKIFLDMMESFDHDLFHLGGDEVYPQCWANIKSTGNTTFDFITIWGQFQTEVLQRLKKANSQEPVRTIVWSSSLTSSPRKKEFLDPSTYIIQLWDAGAEKIRELVKDGYQLIFSNTGAAYLDMGGGTWLGREHMYGYNLWQQFYDNNITQYIDLEVDRRKNPENRQILGGEAALWSEKVNSQNMDAKTWPRGAATAENLWSNPKSRKPFVYSRLNHHNRRLIQLGIHSDQLQPESCYLIWGHCDDPKSPI